MLSSGKSRKKNDSPFQLPYSRVFSTEYENNSLKSLEIALNEATAYQAWKTLDPGKEHSIDERYLALPTLTKKDIREHFPQGFLPHGRDASSGLASGEIEFVKTSGTTGDSVTNIWNQRWWDASEKASWKLNSYASKAASGNHPEAILANPLNVGFVSDDVDLPMEKRRLSRFLYLNEKSNPLSWTPQHMDRMIKELEIYKPVTLEANPSLLAKLCRYIAMSKKKVFQPKLILFTYEYPTRFHIQQISHVFNIPLTSSYGTTEVGYIFMQCEKGKLHQNSEYCRVDLQPLKPEHGGPSIGRILVTTFNNSWYTILRFDVADLAHLDEEGTCACGRDSGLILSAIEGRTASVTLTCKGRLVTLRELDDAISVLDGIDEYQLRQVSRNEYQLQLASQRTDKKTLKGETKEILSKLYGEEAKISVAFKEALAPSASGKYVISQAIFPIDIEDYLDHRFLHKEN
ncbi:MAG: hypothetical protein QG670_1828 [Thermoproteota archaeon]|nr:hypothetical protein [Thermoproteota archaeon]